MLDMPNIEVSGWSPARIEKLKVLYAEGLSFRDIANHLGGGLTRNAVISKTHRLGLPRRLPGTTRLYSKHGNKGVPTAAGIKRRAEGRKATGITAIPAFETEPLPDDGVDCTPLIGKVEHLNERTCKWPIGDPLKPDFGFCGKPKNPGCPYCEHHAERAYYRVRS